jgi:hypothetical protein
MLLDFARLAQVEYGCLEVEVPSRHSHRFIAPAKARPEAGSNELLGAEPTSVSRSAIDENF